MCTAHQQRQRHPGLGLAIPLGLTATDSAVKTPMLILPLLQRSSELPTHHGGWWW